MRERLDPEILAELKKCWELVQKEVSDPTLLTLFAIDYKIATDTKEPELQRYEHAYRFLRRYLALKFKR